MDRLIEFIREVDEKSFAEMIDHTLLKPDANYSLVEKYVKDTITYGFKTLVLPLSLIPIAKSIQPSIKLCSVIGFPLGNVSTRVKVYETLVAAEEEVEEIDVVMNISYLKSGDYDRVLRDLVEVVGTAKRNGIEIVKVIIETALLSDDEKKIASEIVVKAGADFVKTNTGFLGGGATVHDVTLIKNTVGDRAKIKASGGIRHALDAISLILAGASRIGTSSGDTIMKEYLEFRKTLVGKY
ncbi:MAG: deoxyribose-phosphate aldolase [Desulfurococcaceae archaeon]